MLFTVELRSIGISFRLQKDGTWRNTTKDKSLKASDFTSDKPSEITARSASEATMEIEGTIYDIDPHQWPTEHPQLYYTSSVFRRQYTSEPTYEQLKETIASGDDSVNNCLILNVNGKFELRQSPPFNQLINDPTIVVRHETYVAGNGYVGIEASKDDNFINGEFVSSLEFWRDHLRYHTTREYSDLHATQTIDKIRQDLADIHQNWEPDY